MQKQIASFINDLKKEVSKSKFKTDIVSIVLMGSAARGEFVKGESDVDMIIIVKNNMLKEPVNRFFTLLFRKLNKKHKLRLDKTCTTEEKSKHAVLNIIFKIDSFVFVGVPFHVISLDEYDFMRNKVSDPKIWFIATFLGSLNTFLENVKETGKTIYGENLLKKIKVKLTFIDKLKVWLQQQYAILLSLLAFPFDKKQAMKYAFKCSLWQEEFDLLFAHKHLRGYLKDRKDFKKIFRGNKFMLDHLEKSIKYRKDFNKLKISDKECWNFILSTIKFVKLSNKMV